MTAIWTNRVIIDPIRILTNKDKQLNKLNLATKHPASLQLKVALKHDLMKDEILYNKTWIEVPDGTSIKTQILKRRKNSKMAGHHSRAKMVSFVCHIFEWLSWTACVNIYVNGCDSCQQVESVIQKLFGKLNTLPVPEGPWTDISDDLITGLQVLKVFDIILTVIDWLTKMAHLLTCREEMIAKKLADLMLRRFVNCTEHSRALSQQHNCLHITGQKGATKTTQNPSTNFNSVPSLSWQALKVISKKKWLKSMYIISITSTKMTGNHYLLPPSLYKTRKTMY